MDLCKTSNHDLFQLWAQTVTELKRRAMWVNGSPLGWAAEQLVCDRLHLDPTPVNTHYRDAIGRQNRERYQIKARQAEVRKARINGLTDLCGGHFDFLVAVVFQEDHRTVRQAFRMPHSAVLEVANPMSTRSNAHEFTLNANLIARKDVEDITDLLTGPHHTMPF